MNNITRRSFLEVAGISIGGLILGDGPASWAGGDAPAGEFGRLFDQFLNPDRKYSIRPFWFWNGDLKGEELARQIRQMVEHGVYGAYAHNRDGLQVPYLSEAWWKVLGEALSAAKASGFSLCLVDEFEWPSGEARDYWLPGINKSRVLEANPSFHVRRMRPSETIVKGPKRASFPLAGQTVAVVAARRLGPDRLDGDSLRTLSWEQGAKEISWDVPEGEWLVTVYDLELVIANGGQVDLMNREAIAKFIEIYYEEFYRRYGQYFGNAMPATFADHEGDYGGKLPWTPRLFETFRRNAGYDLTAYLPGLLYDIGPKTEKVRCDVLDTVSELYSESFFKQVGDWCKQHNLQYSGHLWEESLFWGAAWQGDYFRMMRSLTTPGCDTLVEWARQSVWLKEAASVANFEGKHLVCENQGIQGGDSYLSPEKMRRVSNCLGAWDIGEFIPHAFNYDLTRTNFPPDWFRAQPFLPWFRAYADQMRRISFVNRESQHIADLLLLYPQVSVWGQASTAFRDDGFTSLLQNSNWTEDAVDTSDQYADLKLRLTEARYDFAVADDYYISQSAIEGKRLRIASSNFQVLILPPMSTTRRSTAKRVRDFYQAGGTVIALRRLPYTSVETGRDDAELKAVWEEVFDTRPSLEQYQVRRNANGGRSYFVPVSVTDLLEVVREAADPDVELLEGPSDHLYVLHKRAGALDLYWVVNDTPEPRTHLLRFRARGRPEKWEADTGRRAALFYQTQEDKTVVRLALGPWDASYVAFDPTGAHQPLALTATNLDDLYLLRADNDQVTVHGRALLGKEAVFAELRHGKRRYRGEYRAKNGAPFEIEGEWKVTVESPDIPLPYAQVRDDPAARGLQERWFARAGEGADWSPLWLSPLMRSIHRWNVIGPFPNPDDRGLEEAYGPEKDKKLDYETGYQGDEGQQLHWQEVNSADEWIGPPEHTGTIELVAGRYGPSSYIVNYGRVLRMSPARGTIYVQTNVYAPQGCEAVMVLEAPHPTAVFINGDKTYSRWLRPLYFQFTDGFATRIPIKLQAGWNSALIKFLHNPQDSKPTEFTCRFERPDGTAMEGLISSPRALASPPPAAARGYRWLRFAVPALAEGLRVPSLRRSWLAFVDGHQVPSAPEIPLSSGTRAVTLRVAADEVLDHPFSFSTAPASLPLGTWNAPGLEHFSGTMTYEKTVEIPASLMSERVLLDCGEVGVCADAWVNGKAVGSRPWAPYVFDVTEHLHAGKNQLKVRVANTEANTRAVGSSRPILEKIDLDGWHGPARLVPFVDRDISCPLLSGEG